MEATLRSMGSCIGLGRSFSVLGQLLGFTRWRLPRDPAGVRVEVSIKQQLTRLRGKHFHLNVIAVGSDQFTDSDYEEIDYSIYKTRNVYGTVNVGIGRIQHWVIGTAEANGLDTPTTTDDLEQLTEDWTVQNDGIDMFVPHNMSIASNDGQILGRSAINGPCDKDAKGMTGATCGLWGREQTARTFAHELGHYLGLTHNHGDACPSTTTERNNLMAQSRCAVSERNSVALTSGQGDTMDNHCSIKSGC